MSRRQFEIINIDEVSLSVDVSLLSKTEELFFNATEMAKKFNKRPDDFWKQKQNVEYLNALVTLSEGSKDDYVKTKVGGKYQGTWFHKDMALQFARWLSPVFAVKLDKWIIERIEQEHFWQRTRMEAKTGFLPMTRAIQKAHDPVQFYHYSNECDLINRIVLGMSAKKYKKQNNVLELRDALDAAQLAEINRLQIINTGLIEIGMDYEERKAHLEHCHKREWVLGQHP